MDLGLLTAAALMLYGPGLHGVLGLSRAGTLAEGDVDLCLTALVPQDGWVYVHLTGT